MRAGKAISSKYVGSTATSGLLVRCYGGNGLRGYVSEPNVDEDRCVIGRQGALCGNVCYAEGPFYATEHAVVVTPKTQLSERYLYHILVKSDLGQYRTAGAQPGLSVARLKRVAVPLPLYEEQSAIAETLDRFDVLTSSLSEGLPAEINARRKQYAYYRDKLLSFREKGL